MKPLEKPENAVMENESEPTELTISAVLQQDQQLILNLCFV